MTARLRFACRPAGYLGRRRRRRCRRPGSPRAHGDRCRSHGLVAERLRTSHQTSSSSLGGGDDRAAVGRQRETGAQSWARYAPAKSSGSIGAPIGARVAGSRMLIESGTLSPVATTSLDPSRLKINLDEAVHECSRAGWPRASSRRMKPSPPTASVFARAVREALDQAGHRQLSADPRVRPGVEEEVRRRSCQPRASCRPG